MGDALPGEQNDCAGESGEGDVTNDHAWFASFAPTRHPQLAVVVLIEHGGFGAKAATPTAMEIYQAYFAAAATEKTTFTASDGTR